MNKKSSCYQDLRERLKKQDNKNLWETARQIYEQCKNKKYKSEFKNQEEFAYYIGISKGMVSHYKKAYEYYLFYKKEIDITKFSVEQVYDIYRVVGKRFRAFSKWVGDEYSYDLLQNISENFLQGLYDEYCERNSKIKSEDTNKNEIKESEIIYYYKKGTDRQKAKIDSIINEIKEGILLE